MKQTFSTIGTFTRLIALGGFALVLNGCAMSMRAPVSGYIYTSTQANEEATSNAGASKRGEACASSILGWIGTGEASIQKAASSAGISKIAYVDSSSFGVLGIYAEYCAIVYGE